MSESTTETVTTSEDVTKQLEAAQAEAEKWKSLSRKNEDRAKENAEAAKRAEELQKRLDEIESSKLSDAEKTEKRVNELANALKAEQEARKASDLAALRARIGAEKGIPAALIPRLQGDDETSIAADADALLESVKGETGFTHIGQGSRGSSKTPVTDPLEAALRERLGITT